MSSAKSFAVWLRQWWGSPQLNLEEAIEQRDAAREKELKAPGLCGHPKACYHSHENSCFTHTPETPRYMHCELVAGCQWCKETAKLQAEIKLLTAQMIDLGLFVEELQAEIAALKAEQIANEAEYRSVVNLLAELRAGAAAVLVKAMSDEILTIQNHHKEIVGCLACRARLTELAKGRVIPADLATALAEHDDHVAADAEQAQFHDLLDRGWLSPEQVADEKRMARLEERQMCAFHDYREDCTCFHCRRIAQLRADAGEKKNNV